MGKVKQFFIIKQFTAEWPQHKSALYVVLFSSMSGVSYLRTQLMLW